jgi:hypothetical protein
MEGDTLHPLNQLKEIFPELYNKQVSKYKGREIVMEQFIPTLGCYWNDVLHLSAIHPKDVKKALVEAGLEYDITIRCYQLDSNVLEKENTTIYFSGDIPSERMKAKNFTEYKVDELDKYSFLPQETVDYYREEIKENRRPLLFHKAPHILYKGSIDIKHCSIVEA